MADLRWDFSDVDAVFAFDLKKLVSGWDANENSGEYKGFRIRWSGLRTPYDQDIFIGWWSANRGESPTIISPILGPVQERLEGESVELTHQPGQLRLSSRYRYSEGRVIALREIAVGLQKLLVKIDEITAPATSASDPQPE